MSPSLPTEVHDLLARVARRRRWLALWALATWPATALGIILLLSFSIDLPEGAASPWVRRPLWLLLGCLVGLPLLRTFLPVLGRTGSSMHIAQALDQRVPATRYALSAAVDLVRSGASGPTADAHLEQARVAAEAVAVDELTPLSLAGPLRLHALVFLGLGVCALLISPKRIVPDLVLLFGPTQEQVASEEAEEGELPPTLVLRNLKVTLQPPAYSGRPELTLDGSTGDFRALPGTRVLFEAEVPKGRGDVRLKWLRPEGRSVEGELAGDLVRLRFDTPGRSSFRVQQGEGKRARITRPFRVEELPDRAPELRVSGPADGTELVPDEPVELAIDAWDDFGLSRLELVAERGGRPLASWPIEGLENGAGSHSASLEWVAADRMTDLSGPVHLVVVAWDNDTVRGPKMTRSARLRLDVQGVAERHSAVLALKRRLLDESLLFLADLLVVADRTAQGKVPREEVLADYKRQAARAQAFFGTAEELLSAMDVDALERRDVALGVTTLIDNVARAWRPYVEVLEDRIEGGRMQIVVGSALALLGRSRASLEDELERMVLDLSAFSEQQVGEGIGEEAADLEPSLADLSNLVRRAAEGEEVSAEIRDAMDRLRKELGELAAAMGEREQGMPEGFVNDVPGELSEDLLQKMERLLAEGRHEEALEEVRRAMEALAELREQLTAEQTEQSGGQASERLRQQLDEVARDLDALTEGERSVLSQTEALERSLGDSPGNPETELAAFRQDVERLRDLIERLPPEGAQGMFRAQLQNWARVVDRLAASLSDEIAAGDLESAARLASESADYLREMRSIAARSPEATAGRGAALTDSGEASELAQSLSDRLGQAAAREQTIRGRAAEKGQPLMSQQKGLRARLDELGSKLAEVGGGAFNPRSVRDKLGTAGQLMDSASARLAQGDLPGAIASERDALKQLQSAASELGESRQGMDQRGRLGPSAGSSGRSGQGAQQMAGSRREDWQGADFAPTGEVELSEPDDFVSPEAFRKLIQQEAAGVSPEGYRPLNRDYYEELAR